MSATVAPASIRTRPLSDLIGADVEGVDSPASMTHLRRDQRASGIAGAGFHHQQLTDVDLMNFSRRLVSSTRCRSRCRAGSDHTSPS